MTSKIIFITNNIAKNIKY